jgi:hypothetical protein
VAPTLVTSYYVESPIGGDSTALVTSAFTPADGEVIIVKATTWDSATASGTPSGGGLTYTSRITAAFGGFSSYVRIFTAVVGTSPGSMQVTLSAPAASSYHSMCVERWSGAQLAATPATDSNWYAGSTSAPSSTLTTVGTGSIVSWACGDSNAVSPATRAYRSSATEDGLGDGSAGVDGVFYHAYQTAAAAGSQAYGLTLPATQKWTLAAIEIQSASGGGSIAGDRLPFMRPPGRRSPVGRFQPLRLADAVPVASTPTAAEQGSAAVGVSTTGTACKVAAQTGIASVGMVGAGVDRKVAPQFGTGTLGAAGTTLERKVAPQLGTGTLGAAGTTLDRKVAPQLGTGATGAAGTALDRKVAPQLGTGTLGAAGTTLDRKVAPQLGTGTLGAVGTATETAATTAVPRLAVTVVTGRRHPTWDLPSGAQVLAAPLTVDVTDTRAVSGLATLGASAYGTARKLAAQLGTGTLGTAGTGLDRKLAPQSGRGAAGATGTALDRKAAVETGAGAFGATGTGIGRKIGVERGSGTFGAVGTGLHRKLAPQRGTAAAGFASTRSSTITRAVAGVSALGTAAYGTARKLAAQLGTATLGTAGSGTGRKLTGQLGTSTLGVTGAGTDRKRAVESGTALVTASSVGEAVKRAISRGLGALGVTGFGSTRPPVVPVVDLYAGAGVDLAPTLRTGTGVDASGLHSGRGVDTSAQLTADG